MAHNSDLVQAHLDAHLQTYLGPDFGYNSYNPPNTTMVIADSLPEILLGLSGGAIRLYLRCLQLLKRNQDPVLACTVLLKASSVQDLFGERQYRRCRNELLSAGLLLATDSPSLVIVHVGYANKLYKPKLEEFE